MPAPRLKLVAKSSWFNLRASADKKNAEVDLIGPIGFRDWDNEGVTVTDFLAKLRELDEVEALTLNIHSPGGLITEGLMMYNGLLFHPATVTANIMGMCGSMATVICCAADTVKMPKNAVFHIHEVQGGAWGSTTDMARAAAEMETYQNMIVGIYEARTGKPADAIVEQMRKDLPLDGDAAKEFGFVDEVMEPLALENCVKFSLTNFSTGSLDKFPVAARAWFDSKPGNKSAPTSNQPSSAPMNADQKKRLKALATQASLNDAEKAELATLKALAEKDKWDFEAEIKADKKAAKLAHIAKLEADLAAAKEKKDDDEKEDDDEEDEDKKALKARVEKLEADLAAKNQAEADAKLKAEKEKENAELKSRLEKAEAAIKVLGGVGGAPHQQQQQQQQTNTKPDAMALILQGIAEAQAKHKAA